MKMTQEEKAKAYDEALERARKQRDDYQKELNKADKNSQLAGLLRAGISAIELAFPELAESEDERFRKYILRCCEETIETDDRGLELSMDTTKKLKVWLERQKEKPLTMESAYEKFVNPETLKEARTNKYIKAQLLWELMHNGIITEVDYQYLTDDKRKPWTAEEYHIAYQKGFDMSEQLKQKEQKPWEWGEEETKLLDSIIDDYEAAAKSFCGYDGKIGLLRAIRDGEYDLPKQERSEEDEKNRRSLNTKEIKVGDTITYFRNGKKGIMLVSSFDSGIYPRCKWGITDIDGTAYGDWTPGSGPYYAATEKEKQQLYDTMPIEVKNWLKSLKPHWKPSEEQMDALKVTLEYMPDTFKPRCTLMTLQNDLEKLM